MKLKIRLYFRIIWLLLMAMTGLVMAGLLFPIINATCNPNEAADHRDFLKQQWLKLLSSAVHLRIEKVGSLPKAPILMVSNHISWLDIILLGHQMPCYFVSKSEIADWPILGYIAQRSGTIFIRRGDKKQVIATAEKMLWLLKQSRNLIAFPEGTTTLGNEVLHFHTALFQPAILTKSLVQPVAIEYLGTAKELAPFVGDDELVPHIVRLLKLDNIPVRITYLPAIDTCGKNRNEISDAAWASIQQQICPNHAKQQQHNQQP